jgi:signal transduction histidine kinase
MRALERSVSRLERVTQDSLDYAQMRDAPLDSPRQPTDVADLVTDVVEAVGQSIAAKRQVLDVWVAPGLPRLMLDRYGTERALLNVLRNATAYAPIGASIDVRADVDQGRLTLRVANTGPGVSPHEQRLIFNEYYRGEQADRQKVPGAGLGLPIAKRLIEAQGGTIAIHSAPDGPTAFTLTVPAPLCASTGPDDLPVPDAVR